MFEVYLVARGQSIATVAGQIVRLTAGDMLVVEPGEPHTFLDSSDDYLHFVVQTPFVSGDKVDLQPEEPAGLSLQPEEPAGLINSSSTGS